MADNKKVMMRKEKAAVKVRRIEEIEYIVEDDDIIITSGKYVNRRVREMFMAGPKERDYLVEKLWFTNDPEIMRIIRTLVCK